MFKIEAVENEATSEKEEKAVVTVEDTVKFAWVSTVGPTVTAVKTVLVSETN